MARESFSQKIMQTAHAPATYVGAFVEDERRLTLVAVNPEDPWEAFRTMRRTMRRTKDGARATIGLYESDSAVEHKAQVISLSSRRRAG